ncbi:PqqD family protein [bacterium]|nr:PqqD family protein [bacterium]
MSENGGWWETESVDVDSAPEQSDPLPEVPLAAVFCQAPRAAWTSIGTEIVVYVREAKTSFVLDGIAGLLWQSIDGESQIDEIVRDISDVFDVPFERVRDDFLPVAAQWMHDGLIERVADD